MDENIRFVKVFTPYHEWHHTSYFGYDTNVFGELPFGTVIQTRMRVAIIIDPDVPEETLPNADIYFIDGLANEKQIQMINKQWWSVIQEIHNSMTRHSNS